MELIDLLLRWLRDNPWGWFLVIGAIILAFGLWFCAPITWRNAEGPLGPDEESRGNGRLRWFL